jgi:hypothetical protein
MIIICCENVRLTNIKQHEIPASPVTVEVAPTAVVESLVTELASLIRRGYSKGSLLLNLRVSKA